MQVVKGNIFRSEYGAFWKCIQAGGIYIFTQLVKMLALATFFPTADNVGEEGFDVFGVRIISSLSTNFVPLQSNPQIYCIITLYCKRIYNIYISLSLISVFLHYLKILHFLINYRNIFSGIFKIIYWSSRLGRNIVGTKWYSW